MASDPNPDPYFVLRSLAKAYGESWEDDNFELFIGATDIRRLAMLFREYDMLLAATRFYADAANWRTPSQGFEAQYDPTPANATKDRGQRAREALIAIRRIVPTVAGGET